MCYMPERDLTVPSAGAVPVHAIKSSVDFRRLLRLAGQLASRTPNDIVTTLPDRGASSPKTLPISFAPAPPATPVRITRRWTSLNADDALLPFLASVDRAIISLKWYGGHRSLACHQDMSGAAASHGDDDHEPESQLAADNPFASLISQQDIEQDSAWANDVLSPHPSERSLSDAASYCAPSALTPLTTLTESSCEDASPEGNSERQQLKRSYSDVVAGRSPSPQPSFPTHTQTLPLHSLPASGPEVDQWRRAVEPRLVEPGAPRTESGAAPEEEGGWRMAGGKKKRMKKPRHAPDRAEKRRARGDGLREAERDKEQKAYEAAGPWGRRHRDGFARSRVFRVYAVNADAEIEYAVTHAGFKGNAKVNSRGSPRDLEQLDALGFWRYDWRDE